MLLLRFAVILIIAIAAVGCSVSNDPARTYTIASGEHLSKPYINPSKIHGGVLRSRIRIGESCNCYVGDNPEQVNKVVGISTRPVIKNDNSAILGWSTRPDNTMDLWLFVNYGDRFEQKHLGVGNTDTWYDLSIWATDSSYVMEFNGVLERMPRNGNDGTFWLVEPYFGGKSPNPCETECIIRVEFL